MVSRVSEEMYRKAREGAAFLDRDRGRLVVSGPDRASFLQGLLTNDIAALAAGRGCYAAYLTPQGRMIADLFVYELADLMLLTVPIGIKDSLLAKLDRLIFTEDVKLGDVTATFAQTAVVGPEAASISSLVLDGVSAETLSSLPEHGNLRARFEGQTAIVTRVTDTGEPGFDVFVERPSAEAFRSRLAGRGVAELDVATAESLRIEAGVPRFGPDMDEETIPLEAGIESRAISFTKGCYVGQEVIVRVLHRGHGRVARKLVGLILDDGPAPAAGAIVRSGEREVGRITSGAISPALKKPIALAYIHRDFVAAGTVLAIDGADALVVEPPFVERQA